MNEYLKVTGDVHILHLDQNKQVVDERNIKNLVVNIGRNTIAARLTGNAQPNVYFMSVGTSGTGASYTDTGLISLVSGSNTAITSATVLANVITYSATFSPGVGTGALQEAGLFSSHGVTSSGNLFCRTTFSTVNKGAADTVIITWTVNIA